MEHISEQQLIAYQNLAQDCINNLNFVMQTLRVQLVAMSNNPEYTLTDINEMTVLLNDLTDQIKVI